VTGRQALSFGGFGEALHKGGVLGILRPAIEGSQDGLKVSSQKGVCIQPESGKYLAFQETVVRRGQPIVVPFSQDEPVDFPIQDSPDDILAPPLRR